MKHFAVLTLLASLLFTASCITQVVAPSSSPVAVTNQHYGLMGTMTADLNCSAFEADKAVRAAAEAMKILELHRTNDQFGVVYEYKDLYENRVTIKLTSEPTGICKIAIKLGKTGDKKFSENFLAALEQALHGTPAE
ncbi:MAG: DUF3568 family protein [Victivallales bacterium]|nr:DUF3568 family protein [Victivallales bacterium]